MAFVFVESCLGYFGSEPKKYLQVYNEVCQCHISDHSVHFSQCRISLFCYLCVNSVIVSISTYVVSIRASCKTTVKYILIFIMSEMLYIYILLKFYTTNISHNILSILNTDLCRFLQN